MSNDPARKPKRKLISFFPFRPFGNILLTDKAAGWFRIVFILVLVMALAESLSWAYIGSTFYPGIAGYISAAVVGGFVFCLVLAVDATLMTLDRANPSYAEVLYDEKKSKMTRLKDYGGIGARILVVSMSLLVTAPFVTQMIFSRDIRREIESVNKTVIAEVRKAIEKKHDDKIGEAQTSLAEQRDLLVKEIGGKAGSVTGQHGYGPTARAIQERITAIEAQISTLTSERSAELDSFDLALKENDNQELRDRWALVLADASPLKRGEMIQKIESTPGFQRTEIAIKSLLAFLFISLLILKIFQPRAVRIYLSEALQDEWKRYEAGAFDGWLEPGDRSVARPRAMTPFRFEDMMMHVFPIQRKLFLSKAGDQVSKQEALNDSQELLQIKEGLREDLDGRIGAARSTLAEVEQKIEVAAAAYESVLTEVETKEAELEKYTREYQEFERIFMVEGDTHQPVSPRMKRVLERLANSADHAQAQMEEAQKGMASLKERETSGQAKLDELRAEREMLRSRLAGDLATLDSVQEEIIAIKLHRIDELRAKRQKGYGSDSSLEQEPRARRQA